MTLEELREANEIKEEINQLERFLFTAERVWQGQLILEKQKYIFKTIPYGALESESVILKGKMKEKVLKIFRDRVKELKERLEEL